MGPLTVRSRISEGLRRPQGGPAVPLLCSAGLGCRRPTGDHGASPTCWRPRRERGFFVRADCEDSTMEIEIGRGKKGRRAYGFDDIAIVPSRRTRDPDDIDISWKLGPYQFELPMMASAMDGVVSPETAGIVGRLGGLAVLNLEGIFTRYEDAEEQLERISGLPEGARHARDAGDLPRAGQARADRPARAGNQGAESRRRGLADPAARAQVPRDRARRRARRADHPGHGRLRRTRLDRLRAAEPQGVHPQPRRARRGRRLRLLPDRAFT